MNGAVPVWLAELHRQWHKARGNLPTASSTVFSRGWDSLLDEAGLRTAEDRAAAGREAAALEKAGRLKLVRHKYRNFILRLHLPPAQEGWLREQFSGSSPAELRERSIAAVREVAAAQHVRWPDEWRSLCSRLLDAFTAGRILRPFHWRRPDAVRQLIDLVKRLTSREWPENIPVRHASVALDLDSKALERHRRALEAAMTLLFTRETTLEALGLCTVNSHVWLAGPLTLHFADGSNLSFDALRAPHAVDGTDLARAVSVSTPAARLLTVENTKTTFRELTAAGQDGRTLFAATSFPAAALRLLLKKLPPDLPHLHHGDTDAAGFAILLHLRRAHSRPVGRCLMDWQDKAGSPALTLSDHRWLDILDAAPEMADCRDDLRRMRAAGRKGDFEQERHGIAALTAIGRTFTGSTAPAPQTPGETGAERRIPDQ